MTMPANSVPLPVHHVRKDPEHVHKELVGPHHACLCTECKQWRREKFGNEMPVTLVAFYEKQGHVVQGPFSHKPLASH